MTRYFGHSWRQSDISLWVFSVSPGITDGYGEGGKDRSTVEGKRVVKYFRGSSKKISV
jgi:hypothetical protein